MKRSIIICLLSALSLQVSAQKDIKAKEVLDAVAANYEKSTGTEIIFGGTMDGSIILKGEKFVLDCGGIKSWFDGKTLWSYVEENAEVNVHRLQMTSCRLQSVYDVRHVQKRIQLCVCRNKKQKRSSL